MEVHIVIDLNGKDLTMLIITFLSLITAIINLKVALDKKKETPSGKRRRSK